MGAALVAMVAELTIGRPDAAEHEAQLRELRARALVGRDTLLEFAEADAAAYAAVVAARRLPRESETDREKRATAMRTTIVTAAEVPLRTAQMSAEVLEMARDIAPIGNPNAVSDAGVAAHLAAAAIRGALLNVRINLPYLPADEPLLETASATAAHLEQTAIATERAALLVVAGRIKPS